MKNKIVTFGVACLLGASVLTGCGINSNKKVEPNAYQTESNSVTYNMLNDTQKAAYNDIVNGLIGFQKEITVNGKISDAKNAFDAVLADHPEFFFTDSYVYNEKQTILGTSSAVSLFPNYTMSKSAYNELMKIVTKDATEVISDINKDESKYKVSEEVYKAIIENVSYNKDIENSNTIAAAFVNKKATCEGYAKAYTYLLQQYGIPCTSVSGTIDGKPHVWTVSMIDKKAYVSDPTNGDAALENKDGNRKEFVNYSFFNMDPNRISNYAADEVFKKLELNSMDANYYVNHNTYLENYDNASVSNMIQETKAAGKNQVTIAFGTPEALTYAEGDLFVNKGIQKILGNVNVNYTVNRNMNTITILF